MQLSIIIVNFNVKYFLEQCLSSVIIACKNIEAEILVLDNNSSDGSKDFFSGTFNEAVFIWNTENVGFSKANNLALKQAKGDCILFLNPDTILPEDCLEKCLAMSEKVDVGGIGVRMIDGSGTFLKESKRGFPSPFVSFCKLTGLTALFPTSKTFARYYLGHLDANKNHQVSVLPGAFMMIRKNVLDKTGGFDERFFMYGEDVDLSYRIENAGFKNVYFSECTIIHFKGESTKKGSLNYIRLFYGAMSLFVKKHYSGVIAGFYSSLIQVVIWTKSLLSGATHWLTRSSKVDKQIRGENPCFIIADKEEFDKISSMIQGDNLAKIIGRISPKESTMDTDALGSLHELNQLIDTHKVKEIIFCSNGLSSKRIIALIQQIPGNLIFKFHFAGTAGIVGSNDKESTGDYTTLVDPDL
ncbi:MAG: glycosyltransferase family 2 protein [Ferruginibacter sp.]